MSTTTTTLDVGYRTDAGRVRERNEDHYGLPLPDLSDEVLAAKGRLYLVADGMGGHKGGQLASQMAVQHVVHEYYQDPSTDPRQSLGRAIRMANAAIFRQAGSSPDLSKMGTTVTAIVVRGDDLYVANVGDSRTYLVRGGTPQQITEDHSFIAQGLKEGTITPEQAASHPYRGVITRALGAQPDVQPDFFHRQLQPGDLLLLCSDGLLNEVELNQIVATMTQSRNAQAAADHLVDQAVQNGGRDNVTVVVVGVNGYQPVAAAAGGLPPWLLPVAAGVLALALVATLLAVFWRPQIATSPTTVALAGTTEATFTVLPSVTPSPQGEDPSTSTTTQLASPLASPMASAESCGNGACDADENEQTCPQDCPTPTPSETATKISVVAMDTNTPEPTDTASPTPSATRTPKPTATASPTPPPDFPEPRLMEPAPRTNLSDGISFKWVWPGEMQDDLVFEMQMSQDTTTGFDTVLGQDHVQDLGGGEYAFPSVEVSGISWLSGKTGSFYWRIALRKIQDDDFLIASEAREFQYTLDSCAACRPCKQKCKPRMPDPPACCSICCP